MNLIQAILLSVVEGITEFLPISSTGHLILTLDVLHIPSTSFVTSFEVIIQLGAIVSVLSLYWKMLLKNKHLLLLLFVGFIPSAIVGLLFYDFIKSYLLGNSLVTTVSLFLGGIALILLELRGIPKKSSLDITRLTYKKAFFIGAFQAVSVVPGVSRAAATIVGGLFAGLNRKDAVVFSFLLAVPTMLAASTLDLVKSEFQFSQQEFFLLGVGLLGAFITAVITIRFLLKFLEKHTFIPFGIYRIVLAVVFWIYLVLR